MSVCLVRLTFSSSSSFTSHFSLIKFKSLRCFQWLIAKRFMLQVISSQQRKSLKFPKFFGVLCLFKFSLCLCNQVSSVWFWTRTRKSFRKGNFKSSWSCKSISCECFRFQGLIAIPDVTFSIAHLWKPCNFRKREVQLWSCCSVLSIN